MKLVASRGHDPSLPSAEPGPGKRTNLTMAPWGATSLGPRPSAWGPWAPGPETTRGPKGFATRGKRIKSKRRRAQARGEGRGGPSPVGP
eukprot:2339404-Pyramimonas_sp.AAC.1